jgi:translation initiation factor 1
MPKKPLNSFESLGNISFDNLAPDVELGHLINDKKILKIQNLEAHFSNKGRAGKVVTIIKGFEGDIPSLKSLAKNIKTYTGTGGTVKNNEIIIQGNCRDKIINYLIKIGHKAKRIGG